MEMNQYFKGYYFKCQTGAETIAFIPALHHDGKESSASLQIITNDNAYVIPYSQIRFGKNKFEIRIGPNYFSKKGIYLDIDSKECKIRGTLKFGKFQKIKYSIMGFFEYVPYMQCKHSIISMQHSITGKINLNNNNYNFNNGVGYIEGDSGRSFPKEYIWTQCHWKNNSIMLSVAHIPLCGFHFTGIIGIIMIAGREYRIATYLGAKIISISNTTVVIRQGNYTLSARLIESRNQCLNAPVNGKMIRTIHESASCKAWYQFDCGRKTLLKFISESASFEHEFR